MKTPTQSPYNQVVLEFLEAHKITARVNVAAEQTCPERCKAYPGFVPRSHPKEQRRTLPHNHGHKYTLVLERGVASGKQSLVISEFWNSINSRYDTLNINGEIKPGALAAMPNVYDILSSVSLDWFANQETFEEWASNRGYDTDSRSAERIYVDCIKEALKAQRFFTSEELDALSELAR